MSLPGVPAGSPPRWRGPTRAARPRALSGAGHAAARDSRRVRLRSGGFFRRGRLLGDEFFGWLAVAALLAGISLLNYSLYPSSFSGLIHAGDIFRLCFYVTLLVGSVREIWSYWRALSQAAVAEERQRIARDLHDGLAQELACVARNLDSLDTGTSGGTIDVLRGAVHRAQLESRRAVSALAPPRGQAGRGRAGRGGGRGSTSASSGSAARSRLRVRVRRHRQDAIVRIASRGDHQRRPAQRRQRVHLELERDGPRLRLRVSDRGRGFDPGVRRRRLRPDVDAPAGPFGRR